MGYACVHIRGKGLIGNIGMSCAARLVQFRYKLATMFSPHCKRMTVLRPCSKGTTTWSFLYGQFSHCQLATFRPQYYSFLQDTSCTTLRIQVNIADCSQILLVYDILMRKIWLEIIIKFLPIKRVMVANVLVTNSYALSTNYCTLNPIQHMLSPIETYQLHVRSKKANMYALVCTSYQQVIDGG